MNAPARVQRSPYLVGALYDWAFFLAPPAVAFVVGVLVAFTPSARAIVSVGHVTEPLSAFLLGAIIHAHLVAVFFRSHANPSIFRRHRLRFVVLPLALFALLVSSAWATAASFIVATAWDVWHSGAQTFGFGRIYDARAGASPATRRLDFVASQVLYAGPILAGATLAAHLADLEEFSHLDHPLARVLASAPPRILAHHGTITAIVLVVGAVVLVAYVAAHVRLRRAGQPISSLKVFLVASTGACSIVTWAFDPFREAFLVMNLFHAVQYLALVWATEGEALAARLRLPRSPMGRGVMLVIFLASVALYGVAVEALDPDLHVAWAVTVVVSLMHFWYDGFVWSVRAGDV